MMRTGRFAAAVLPVAEPIAVAAQTPAIAAAGGIPAREIDGDLRFPSHDVLERQAPATRRVALSVMVP